MRSLPAAILIVDDNIMILTMLQDMLAEAGYTVQAVLDGATALTIVSSNPPALVLFDYAMPVMDGAEFARRVRASGSHVPLVLVSASLYIEPTLLGNINGSLPKPFELAALLAMVARFVLPDQAPS